MKNIVLTGFMGSGKTAVSKALAKKLKWKIEDTDRIIVKKAKMPITAIFRKYGEAHFRGLETKAAEAVSKKKNRVVATGGGIVGKAANIRALKKNGIIIFLKNTFKTSKKRLKGKTDRPLFKDLKKAKALFLKRQKLYRKAADITVVTDKKTVKQVVETIIRKLKI